MIKITFPDGAVREYAEGVSPMEVAKSISEGLARNVLAAEVNGKRTEASTPITTDASIKLFTWKDTDGKEAFWHSSAHLLAEAVQSIFPKAKFGIGPAIENGFYYDIDFGGEPVNAEVLTKLEEKMKELAKQDNAYVMSDISKADAIDYFTKKGDNLKLDLLQDLPDGEITFCTQ
eukprot:gene45579-61743_t